MQKNKLVLFISLFMPYSVAFAEGGAGSSPLSSMLMFGAIIVMMYFMMIRPQSKRAKEHKKLISELAIGDEVLINGGVLGVISKVADNFLKVTIADGVEITVQRQAIANALPKGTLKSIK